MDINLAECTEEELDKVKALVTGCIIMSSVPSSDNFVNQLKSAPFQEGSQLTFNVIIILTGQAVIDAINQDVEGD